MAADETRGPFDKRTFDASLEAFRSMPDDEWQGLLRSLLSGGVLEHEEQRAFEIVLEERSR